MDSLQDILGKKHFTPPDEITLLKDYISRNYDSPCRIKTERGSLIVSVPNSALAGTLQLERTKISQKLGLQHKLVIQVGR